MKLLREIQPRVANPLTEPMVTSKLDAIAQACELAIVEPEAFSVPTYVARSIQVYDASDMPKKVGVSKLEGRARLLHDLASIELQAMELGFRTLVDFSSEAPNAFSRELAKIVLDEAKHLKGCLDELKDLGFQWGDWPCHLSLWNCASEEDTLLERLAIVHRYLEGSGLDASEKILRRLSGQKDPSLQKLLEQIYRDEKSHVSFGSRWFHRLCQLNGLSGEKEFERILLEVFPRLPRRLERMNHQTRQKVGFTKHEIQALSAIQQKQAMTKN